MGVTFTVLIWLTFNVKEASFLYVPEVQESFLQNISLQIWPVYTVSIVNI